MSMSDGEGTINFSSTVALKLQMRGRGALNSGHPSDLMQPHISQGAQVDYYISSTDH